MDISCQMCFFVLHTIFLRGDFCIDFIFIVDHNNYGQHYEDHNVEVVQFGETKDAEVQNLIHSQHGDGPDVLGIASRSSLRVEDDSVGYRVFLAYQSRKPSVTLVPKDEKRKLKKEKRKKRKLLTYQYQVFDVDYSARSYFKKQFTQAIW